MLEDLRVGSHGDAQRGALFIVQDIRLLHRAWLTQNPRPTFVGSPPASGAPVDGVQSFTLESGLLEEACLGALRAGHFQFRAALWRYLCVDIRRQVQSGWCGWPTTQLVSTLRRAPSPHQYQYSHLPAAGWRRHSVPYPRRPRHLSPTT